MTSPFTTRRHDFLVTLRDEDGNALPFDTDPEAYPVIVVSVRHADCGGDITVSHVGTSEYHDCQRCRARWQATFNTADEFPYIRIR